MVPLRDLEGSFKGSFKGSIGRFMAGYKWGISRVFMIVNLVKRIPVVYVMCYVGSGRFSSPRIHDEVYFLDHLTI